MEEDFLNLKGGIFFEKQNEKDCLIHAINNAFGRSVLDKEKVLGYIRENASKIYQRWCCSDRDPEQEVKRYIDTVMLDRNTMFSADVIWKAAMHSGAVKRVIKIPGFSGRYADGKITKALPVWARSKPVVILGETPEGGNHAIALRDGRLFDSESAGPAEFTDANLKVILRDVHAAYAFE